MTVGPQSHWFQVNESSFLPRACAGRGREENPAFLLMEFPVFSSYWISSLTYNLKKKINSFIIQ